MNQWDRNAHRFQEWWCRRTPDEFRLQGDALEFELRYFKDLRLESAAAVRGLLAHQVQGPDGQWCYAEDDPPLITIDGWIFKYRRFKQEWAGLCHVRTRTISIRPLLSELEQAATLLHEMIHAYEVQIPPAFREWLVVDLYCRLLRRLPAAKLRRCIDSSTHSLVHNSAHGVLFLLKSFDLDLRRRWPLGTVFGYGREEIFNGRWGEK